jgi:hypothetical protein
VVPPIIIGRRPIESDSLPVFCSSTTSVSDPTSSPRPTHVVLRCSASTTNSGTSELRMPKIAQPVPPFTVRAAW